MGRTYLGLGSNLGDRISYLQKALQALAKEMELLKVSTVFESAPIDCPPGSEKFLNLACSFQTEKSPEEILTLALETEASLGRTRNKNIRNAPRVIDIDLLYIENVSCQSERLTLPHPRLKERLFALAPLREIAPELPLYENFSSLSENQKCLIFAPWFAVFKA